MTDKFDIQASQYQFPYHYLVEFSPDFASGYRYYNNYLEYACYAQHIIDFIDSYPGESVLEVGCGDGRIIGSLKNTKSRVGVDLCKEAIELGALLNPEVDFLHKDVNDLGSTFDVVFASQVLEHVPDSEIESFVTGLVSRLNSGGLLLIVVPSVNKKLVPKHYRHYDVELMQSQLTPVLGDLNDCSYQYIFGRSKKYDFLNRLIKNKYWHLHSRFIDRYMWSYVWSKLREATPKTGHHLLFTAVKK